MARQNRNTTLDNVLYRKIQILALLKKVNGNDLIEEGMEYIINKYGASIDFDALIKVENAGDNNDSV